MLIDNNTPMSIYDILSSKIAVAASKSRDDIFENDIKIKNKMKDIAEKYFYKIVDDIFAKVDNGKFYFYDMNTIIVFSKVSISELNYPKKYKYPTISIKTQKNIDEITSENIRFFVICLKQLFKENCFPDINEIEIIKAKDNTILLKVILKLPIEEDNIQYCIYNTNQGVIS